MGRAAVVVGLGLGLGFGLSCGGDDGGKPSASGTDGGSAPTSASEGGTAETTEPGGSTGGGTTTDATSTSRPASTGPGETTSASESGGGLLGPTIVYQGLVGGGVVPGWDPDDPRPLVMMGRMGTDWLATLARLGDDGALSENAADEIVVWGWAEAPPLLYDGPVGGLVPDWDPTHPIPLVMLGHRESDGAWWSTLSTIAPDGATGTNVADRIVVWGWPDATPGAPTEVFAGPLDGNAVVPGWDADAPAPLVMMGTFTGTGIWQSTLARIDAGGRLSDNLATDIVVWGW